MNARLEAWLDEHGRLTAGVVLALALIVRLRAAGGTFLNPDEALHFLVANKTSWALAYHASLTTAHPPLLIFILYFWRGLGTSEFILRLPSVIAGTAFCWLLFRWMSRIFGRGAGWTGLVFASFLPPLIALSAEVRQYALLLFFMSAALLLLERAFANNSAVEMLLAYVCVLLALLTHYSALFFAAALGVYSLLRWMDDRYPAGLKAVWAAGQLAVLALFGFLYRTHLARLHSGTAITGQGWLSNSLFHHGQSLLLFVFARTFGVFQFVFGQLAVGDVAGLLFVAGMVYLLRGRKSDKAPAPRNLAFLLALPLLLTCAASIAGVYPYGGTRHSAFLVPFAIAGVSLGLGWLAKQKLARGLAFTLAMVVVSAVFGAPHRPYMTRADQSLENMSRAMTFLRQNVPPDGVILADNQTGLLLSHYLCEQKPVSFDRSISGFLLFRCGGFRVLSAGPETTVFTASSFLKADTWLATQDGLHLKPGDPFWVVQAGWDIDLALQLQRSYPQFRDIKVESFGRNIQIFRLALEPEAAR
jgi:hypothetical protein